MEWGFTELSWAGPSSPQDESVQLADRAGKVNSRKHSKSIALPAEEGEDQAQDDANNNAGDDREIERGVSPLNPDVAGQTAQPTGAEAAP